MGIKRHTSHTDTPHTRVRARPTTDARRDHLIRQACRNESTTFARDTGRRCRHIVEDVSAFVLQATEEVPTRLVAHGKRGPAHVAYAARAEPAVLRNGLQRVV